MTRSWWIWLGTLILGIVMGGVATSLATRWFIQSGIAWPHDATIPRSAPFVPSPTPPPLQKYAITELQQQVFASTDFQLEEEIVTDPDFTGYRFFFKPLGRSMSGQINIPHQARDAADQPFIIMLRGYAPLEGYTTGTGTKNAAAALARHGYVTVAPDFFGYGQSDPEPEDSWQARVEKPVIIAQLLATLEQTTLAVPQNSTTAAASSNQHLQLTQPGIWAHSNGGQIALTTLEILRRPIPTTLWAPVTAPFPYSVLYFSDESDDEGKALRKWLAMFETDYDVFDFNLTRHLDSLTGNLLLHQGTADTAVPTAWSDAFARNVAQENRRRQKIEQETTTSPDSTVSSELIIDRQLPPINLVYHRYPDADHNLRPDWQTVVNRDLEFFDQQFTH